MRAVMQAFSLAIIGGNVALYTDSVGMGISAALTLILVMPEWGHA